MEIFIVTAPGLESIAAGEAKALGTRGNQEAGGVSFSGDLRLLYLANLHLRTPSRIIVRLGRFHASTFYELERRAKKMAWGDFIPANAQVDLRVTCHKSRLYHSDAVAERILSAMSAVRGDIRVTAADTEVDEDPESPAKTMTADAQLFVVRIVNDQCEISADSSGALLHRRGYRQEVAKAPLRETLAAAMILASGWRPDDCLLDPMCGSGTIPIEAAMIARRIAPGLRREFQFMRWPSFDGSLWKDLLARSESEVRISSRCTIKGADRDAGAIAAASRNAKRAGVASDIELATQPLSASLDSITDAEPNQGWIITNPPYGIRVGETGDLRNLYARLGSVAKENSSWRLGVLTDDQRLARHTGIPLRSRFETTNGGIPVSFLASEKAGKLAATRSDSA